VLGKRFLLLTHRGRKSGSPHQTVLEVLRHEKKTDAYFVISAFGRSADWYLNVKQTPEVTIAVQQQPSRRHAKELSEIEAANVLLEYARRHPFAFREISILFTGKPVTATEENCRQFAKSMPVIALERLKVPTGLTLTT
jgi:deazaflavin-dependent oxidoreductase (nitroreductase family)